MIFQTQNEIVKVLSDPAFYGVKNPVVVKQSHISWLFLTDVYAYKLKRAVLYPNVDFSTPEKRRLACVSEMKRSTVYAPHLIEGIVSVRRLKNGQIVLGGRQGEEVDTVLKMRRIPDDCLVENMIENGTFDRFEAMDMAEQLADLHAKAQTFHHKWGPEELKRIILEIESISSLFCADLFDKKHLDSWTKRCLDNVNAHAALIQFRQKAGHVRKCHGELLLSNIAFEDGHFLFFSPVEYNEALDKTDTLYDLANLTMDLEYRGLRRLANILFNHYMAYTNDMAGFPLMSLYQSVRAMRRAHVWAKKTTILKGISRRQAIREARGYFDLACHFMTPFHPILIACGGLSGSGKSRVAREIGGLMNPAPGAVIVRDDIVRKQILGLKPEQTLDPTYATPAFEKVVYDVLRQQARAALAQGSCVIIDALFYNSVEREAAKFLSKEANVPFVGLWMEAPLEERTRRVEKRLRNPSDVRRECELVSQLNLKTGRITWHRISTAGAKEETIRQVVRILKKYLKGDLKAVKE